MAAEEFGAFAGVGVGFEPAEFAIGVSELDGADAGFFADFGKVGAGFGDEVVGEEVAVSVDETQAGGFVSNAFHKESVVYGECGKLGEGWHVESGEGREDWRDWQVFWQNLNYNHG